MLTGTNNSPRIIRGKPPKQKFTEHTYKKAKPFLLRDFQKRCAYSQQHTDRSLGETTMEIDHFNPSITGPLRHKYENLFLSTRHCNGSKSNIWPTRKLRKSGVRFLNPCAELDYGCHIFEHPVTHRLVGVTPAGKYHVISCDLNAEHLNTERRERAKIWEYLEQIPITVKPGNDWPALDALKLLREQVIKMIPPIPYLPKDCTEYKEELDLIDAMLAMQVIPQYALPSQKI